MAWHTWTCPFGYPTEGAWQALECEGAHAAAEITVVDRSHAADLLVTGDALGRIRAFRYPACAPPAVAPPDAIAKNTSKSLGFSPPSFGEYTGHSGVVRKVRWAAGDKHLLSVGGPSVGGIGGDRAVMQWRRESSIAVELGDPCGDSGDDEAIGLDGGLCLESSIVVKHVCLMLGGVLFRFFMFLFCAFCCFLPGYARDPGHAGVPCCPASHNFLVTSLATIALLLGKEVPPGYAKQQGLRPARLTRTPRLPRKCELPGCPASTNFNELATREMPDAICQLPGARSQVPDPRCQIPGAKSQVQDPRCQIPRARSPGARFTCARFQVADSGCQILSARSKVPDSRWQILVSDPCAWRLR